MHCSRNNGYAISTPTWEQYRGDGVGIISSHCYLVLNNWLFVLGYT